MTVNHPVPGSSPGGTAKICDVSTENLSRSEPFTDSVSETLGSGKELRESRSARLILKHVPRPAPIWTRKKSETARHLGSSDMFGRRAGN